MSDTKNTTTVPLPENVVHALEVLASACALHNLKLALVQIDQNIGLNDPRLFAPRPEMTYSLATCAGYVCIKQEI